MEAKKLNWIAPLGNGRELIFRMQIITYWDAESNTWVTRELCFEKGQDIGQ